MNAESLDAIRSKMQRISGHPDLSQKQLRTLCALTQAVAAIEGTDRLAELFE